MDVAFVCSQDELNKAIEEGAKTVMFTPGASAIYFAPSEPVNLILLPAMGWDEGHTLVFAYGYRGTITALSGEIKAHDGISVAVEGSANVALYGRSAAYVDPNTSAVVKSYSGLAQIHRREIADVEDGTEEAPSS